MKQASPSGLFCAFVCLFLVFGVAAVSLMAAEPVDLKDEAGNTIIKYIVDAPEGVAAAGATDPAKQVGLFLCFPEHDTDIDSNLYTIRQALWRMGISDNYVILAAGPQERKFGLNDHEPISKLIAWAKKTYPVNPRRVYMLGKGEGGKISVEFASLHSDMIAGAIMNSWGAWRMASETDKPFDFLNSEPEFYVSIGLRDLPHHLTTVAAVYPRYHAKGYRFIYRQRDDMHDRSYFPEVNDDAIAWATRLRNKKLPLSGEEQNLLNEFSGSSIPAPNDSGYYTDLALVGGAQAGAVLQKLLDSSDAKVRAAAAETFSHGFFGEAAVKALAKKTSDPSTKVRRTAMRALAVNANWRSQVAQDALIQVATDTSLEFTHRLDAVDGLGYAIRLQADGFQQDPEVFKALLSLREDENGPIRSAASILLAPTFDPVPTERGRLSRSPEGGWDQWLEKITLKAAGVMKEYAVCESRSETTGSPTPEDLFCRGGEAVKTNPAAGFKLTLQAAEQGYVPAEVVVGMMYANGKGVQQDYAEAGKWWVKAADAGHVEAASHAAMLYRNGEGVARDRELSTRMAQLVEQHAPELPH